MFLETLITEINELISSTRKLYYENLAKKLNIPLLQANIYWSVVITVYNPKNCTNSTSFDRQYPISNIQTKVNIFNKFFAKQCTPLKNNSVFPIN